MNEVVVTAVEGQRPVFIEDARLLAGQQSE